MCPPESTNIMKPITSITLLIFYQFSNSILIFLKGCLSEKPITAVAEFCLKAKGPAGK